jgi:beta-N-acetylhexosaminidase
VEFVPFREAIRADLPSVLVAHLNCPGLDPEAPSSLSPIVITDILRAELGFDGVVVSDDMEMGAITERCDIGEAAIRFIEAGGDLVLVCRSAEPQEATIAALEAAVRTGRLSRQRIQASLARLSRFHSRIAPREIPVNSETVRSLVRAPEREALVARLQAAEAPPSMTA